MSSIFKHTLKVKPSLKKRIGLKLYSKEFDVLVKQHPLRTIFWECTLRCNLNCRHCGSDCKSSSVVADMPKEDFLRAIYTVLPHVDVRKLLVVITGGEALMRKDLEEVGCELQKRGVAWGVVTNGMLLTQKRMESLVASGMRAITLSVDGFAEQHNYIRQNEHSFTRAAEAIKIMVSSPVRYDIVTCVNRDNFKTLRSFYEFLLAEGVQEWRLFTIFPVGRALQDEKLQLPNEQFRELMEFIREVRKEGRMRVNYSCEGFLGNYEAEVRDNFFGCTAGITTAGIRIDGSLSGCTSIRCNFDQGNIYKDNLWEVWNRGYEKFRNRSWARKGVCAECNMFSYCRGNGMHLYNEKEELIHCNYHKLGSEG